MDDLTSRSVLNGICTGDNTEGWAKFVSIYGPLIENWLRRRSVSSDLADDVRQEVLVKVHESIADFQHNGRPGAFRAWLRQVTVHRLRTLLRRRWRDSEVVCHQMTELADQLETDDSNLTQLWNSEHDSELLERLLEMVSVEFKPATIQAFRQIALEDKPAEAVAAELNLSVNAVRIAHSRVLSALRRVGEGLLPEDI